MPRLVHLLLLLGLLGLKLLMATPLGGHLHVATKKELRVAQGSR